MVDYAAHYDQDPEQQPGATPTFGDYLKTAGASVTGAGADLAAAAAAATADSPHPELQAVHQLTTSLQGYLNHVTDQIGDSRSEEAKALAAAAVTSKEFLAHPAHWAGLQLTGMTGPVLSMVFSGGPLEAAIANGTLQAGSYQNDVSKLVDGMDSGELGQNKYYAGLRSMGMGEDEARDGLKAKLLGDGSQTAYNFMAGAVAGATGGAAKIAGKIAGKAGVGLADAETGLAGRTAAGAGEGAAGGALQAGVGNATLQAAQIDANPKKEFDQDALVNAVLGNVVVGGVVGAAGGAIAGKGKTKAKPKDAPTDGISAEDPAAQEQGSGSDVAPVQAAAKGSTEATPDSGSPAQVPGAKGEAIKSKANAKKASSTDNTVEPAPVVGPDTAQAAALKPVDTVTPPEVQAAVKDPELAPKPVEPAPQPPPTPEPAAQPPAAPEPAPVTPEVTPAPEPAPVSSVAPPQPTGRVLAPTRGEALVRDVAAKKAAADQAKSDLAAANAEAKAVGERKRGEEEKAHLAARDKAAEEVFNTTHKPLGELPVDKKGRLEMVAELDKTLAAAAEKGLVPRETLPEKLRGEGKKRTVKGLTPEETLQRNLSIPSKVAASSPHVRYLRELIEVQKALRGNKFGPASDQRARVADFITEHNAKDLTSMGERRAQVGAQKTAVHQGDIEAPSGKVADAMAAADHSNESTQSPEDRLLAKEEAGSEDAPSQEVEQGKSVAAVKDATERAKPSVDKRAARKAALEATAAKEKAKSEGEHAAADKAKYATTQTPEERAARKAALEATAAKEKAKSEGEHAAASEGKKVEVSAADKAKYATTQTPEERAAWLEKNAARDAAKKAAEPKTEEPKVVEKTEEQLYEHTSSLEKPRLRKVGTGEEATPIVSTNVSHAIDSLDFDHMTGVSRALAPLMRKMLKDLVGHTELHVLSDEDMNRVAPDRRGESGLTTKGFFYRVIGKDRTDEKGRYIAIRASELKDARGAAHVIVHEAVHDVINRALERDHSLNNAVRYMADAVREFARGDVSHELASRYALTNTREFVSEAFSNKEFQDLLAQIPASPELVRVLKLSEKRSSVWDAMIEAVRGAIKNMIGHDAPQSHSMLEAVIRIGDHAAEQRGKIKDIPERNLSELQKMVTETHKRSGLYEETSHLTAKQAGDHAADMLTNVGGMLRRGGRKLLTNHMIADGAEKHVGEGVKKLISAQAMKDAEKDKILQTHGGVEVVRRQAELERSHPEAMEKANDLIFEASNQNVNLGRGADNSHLGKNATKGWQAKKMLPELQKRFNALPEEVQAHLQKSVKFFRDIHNEVARAVIDNVLESAGIKDPALTERIFKDGLTDADKEKWGDKSGIVSALNAATTLKEIKGWYAPFRRYGDFVTSGSHELTVPKNAIKINDSTLQFQNANKAQAARDVKAYVEQDAHTPQGNHLKDVKTEKVWVDKNDPTKLTDDHDINGVQAYRVTMQTQHTEFHDTQAEASRNEDILKEAGLTKVSSTIRDEAHRTSPGMEGALGSVIRSLERNESYNKLDDTQKKAVKQSLMDASVSAMGSTNIKSSMAHRRNVAGMSRDLGRVTADYARMTANYLSGLRFGPKIAAAFGEMRAHIDANKYDGDRLKREEIYNELHSRVYGAAGALADRAPNPVTRKLLQVSRLARLAGVSFHVINSMEPITTSLPMIGGRHGFAQATKAIVESYNLIGGMGAIKAGLKDTVKAFTNDHGFTDYVGMFKDNIAKSNTMGGAMSKFLMETLDYANERNLWGNDAVFEVGQTADPSGNLASRALDRADRMANQVGAAVEGNNRAVTLLAAARLELKKNGGNAEAAKAYAYKMAVETMGDYSAWNASPIFNSGAGKMVLQFKKFAQKSYYMLGKSMVGAIHGDKEAAKQFVGLMMTHALVAGALGLPGLEPFKVAMMVSNAFGISGYDPGDFDNDVRHLAARVFGAKGGEMASHGIFRGLGVEVSNRLGWDNLLTYGNPKSNKPNDVKAWLWDTLAGAPAGYLLDQIKTAQSLMKGDVAGAIATASPIRAVSDLAKAYSGAAGPKLGKTGIEQHKALTPYQTGVRALGFTPAVTAEDGAMRGAVASDTKKLTEERSALVNGWVNAKPGTKGTAWSAVQKWNAGQPKEAQVQMKDLTNAAKRRTKSEADGTTINGIHVSKRTKAIYNSAAATYNP